MKAGAIIIEGHVQGLSNVRALGEAGVQVWVMDNHHCLAQHSRYCLRYYRCPEYTSQKFIEFLVAVGKENNLNGWVLIPSNDHIVENLSRNREMLHPYYKTIVPPVDILENIINKKNLLEVATRCGTPVPFTCYPEFLGDHIENIRFPVLVKGTFGLSFYKNTHQKAVQVNSKEELIVVLKDISQKVSLDTVMIQELIPYDKDHKVVSFSCFANKGEILTFWMGDKLREHPIKYGTATLSRSIYVPQVLESAIPLLKSLGYTGVCEIEFLCDSRDGVYKLIEINPRTWLWVGLAKSCGINYALYIYNYLNGIENTYPQEYKVGVKWINYVTDTVYSIVALFRGVLSIREYIISLRGKKVKAIFSCNDIMPGVVFPFLLFYIAKKRG